MKPRLFASDLHLSPDRPQAAAAFRAFCTGPAREASAVYLLGDLFDWWIGDDQLGDRFAADAAKAIRGIADAGIPVHFTHGNRDFLIGERFARATGTILLPECQLLDIDGTMTLISHGDELCTRDVDYQNFRARMRDPATQRRLLRLPLFVRRALARWLRRKSRDAMSLKAEFIMDVDDEAVVAAFRQYDVERIIHGHTHRPATHVLEVDGRARERVVLAEWQESGPYIEVDAAGVRRRVITG